MIYAVDIGSTLRGRFAWCRIDDDGTEVSGATAIMPLVRSLARDLEEGARVALGFEAPLFLPVPRAEANLSRGRTGEHDRSWGAPAGAYAACLGLHQSAWILRELRSRLPGPCDITFDPGAWAAESTRKPFLLCWEAFVSGAAHGTHLFDAATAAMAFQATQDQMTTAVTAEDPISLLGAAALWSGWVSDLRWLHEPVVVVRPRSAWTGNIAPMRD